jgi:hypothetical protein
VDEDPGGVQDRNEGRCYRATQSGSHFELDLGKPAIELGVRGLLAELVEERARLREHERAAELAREGLEPGARGQFLDAGKLPERGRSR